MILVLLWPDVHMILVLMYTLVQINLNTCKKESIFESFCFILKITKVQAVSEIINN